MNGFNENGEKHGPWEEYWENGKSYWKGNYVNGKKHGLCEHYGIYGKLSYKVNFVNGNEHGLSEWYSNGKLYIKQYWL